MSGRCDRDSLRIERILVTYQRLKKRLEFTGTSRDSFVDDVSEEGLLVYHAIMVMVMVLQIVEDAGMLSDYVKGAISNQPWRNIRDFAICLPIPIIRLIKRWHGRSLIVTSLPCVGRSSS